MSNEIQDAVRAEILEAATDIEALAYAEVYEFNDDQIAECMRLQHLAVISVAFPGEVTS